MELVSSFSTGVVGLGVEAGLGDAPGVVGAGEVEEGVGAGCAAGEEFSTCGEDSIEISCGAV